MATNKQIQANRLNGLRGGKPQSDHTKLMVAAKRKFNLRASKMAARLLSSQAIIANGTHTLMRIDEIVHYRDDGKVDKQGNATKSRYVERKFVVVTDPEELETVMNDFGDVDGSGVVDGKYYFMTHEKPNNQAIDSILNRVFGKAKETMEIINPEGDIDNVVKEKIDTAIFEYFTGKSSITIPLKKSENNKALVPVEANGERPTSNN